MKPITTILIIAVIFIIILAIAAYIGKNKYNSNHKTQNDNTHPNNTTPIEYHYKIKQKYLSNCEISFYNTIKDIIKDKYKIFPQVPLSQIIIKQPETKWHTELFRIIDFCIFSNDYTPLICIEINDKTHHQKERYNRDKKVENILNEAGLPLITLWTDWGVNKDYIERRLNDLIEL